LKDMTERRSGAGLMVAWDTCTLRGTLAAGGRGMRTVERTFEARKGHAGWLMPDIESLLGAMGFGPESLAAVAVGTGPGTFTGVKVGVSTAKGVSLGLRVPLVGISTLDVLAAAAPRDAGLVLATIDARRGMLYFAAFHNGPSGPERLTDYSCMTPGGVAREVSERGGHRSARVCVVGEASPGLLEALSGTGLEVSVGEERYPRGRDLLDLAMSALERGGPEVGTAASVLPIYLRKPV